MEGAHVTEVQQKEDETQIRVSTRKSVQQKEDETQIRVSTRKSTRKN